MAKAGDGYLACRNSVFDPAGGGEVVSGALPKIRIEVSDGTVARAKQREGSKTMRAA